MEPSLGINNASSVWEKIRPITDQILSNASIREILSPLSNNLRDVFDCEALTLYGLDLSKRQLYSFNFNGPGIKEIRVDISPHSIAGFVAAFRRPIVVGDVYSQAELIKYHPKLEFDSSWDRKTHFKTRSMLAVPLPYNRHLIGILQ
ncbi:MAG: GAF domain-containing protein, partial [Nitrospinales bacterium]